MNELKCLVAAFQGSKSDEWSAEPKRESFSLPLIVAREIIIIKECVKMSENRIDGGADFV